MTIVANYSYHKISIRKLNNSALNFKNVAIGVNLIITLIKPKAYLPIILLYQYIPPTHNWLELDSDNHCLWVLCIQLGSHTYVSLLVGWNYYLNNNISISVDWHGLDKYKYYLSNEDITYIYNYWKDNSFGVHCDIV